MTLMWRRYSPMTKRFRLARIFITIVHSRAIAWAWMASGADGHGHWPPNDYRPRGTDIDGIEMLQACGQLGRPEGPVSTDVNASQENNEGHSIPFYESPTRDPSSCRNCSTCACNDATALSRATIRSS